MAFSSDLTIGFVVRNVIFFTRFYFKKPRSSIRANIECTIAKLEVRKRFIVAFEMRLWSQTLAQVRINNRRVRNILMKFTTERV